MSNNIYLSSLFSGGKFSSYSEFYLAMVIAKDFGRRGYIIDMSDMEVDKSTLNEQLLVFFKRLVSDGIIDIGTEVEFTGSRSKLDRDISAFDSVQDVLYRDDGSMYVWDLAYAVSDYGDYANDLCSLSSLDTCLMHIVGKYFVDMYLGVGEKKPLTIRLSNNNSKSTHFYIHLYSCIKSLEWVRKGLVLDLDLDGSLKVDIDYSIHCTNGRVAGRYRFHSVKEKLGYLSKLGIVDGSIAILWTRKGMCENNDYGKIESAIVVRVDEVGDDFLGITSIAVNKTKEEIERDYYDIPSDSRSMFSDMLNKPPYIVSKNMSISELGIDDYFLNEEFIISTLDSSEKVTKLITIDGKQAEVELSAIDAIYWLLCQNSIDFDRELYKSMYSRQEDLLWDTYGVLSKGVKENGIFI